MYENEIVTLSAKLRLFRLSNLLIWMMCPSSTPLSFMDWKACFVQTLRPSTFTSSISFSSSVGPPWREQKIFVKHHNIWWVCAMAGVCDRVVTVVNGSRSWLRMSEGGQIFLCSPDISASFGTHSESCSEGTRISARRVNGQWRGRNSYMKCLGLWLELYLHIQATDNSVM
jgi:hypothetical protein